MSDLEEIRATASANRHSIFKILLGLPHDEKFLGYLLTKKAKALGLVAGDKKYLKGNTIVAWAKSTVTDGPNTPNAWACTAAVHMILDYQVNLPLSLEEVDTFSFYLALGDYGQSIEQAKNRVLGEVTLVGKLG